MKIINGWSIPEQGDKYSSEWGQHITDFMSGHAPLFTSSVGASGYTNQFATSGHNHDSTYLGLGTSAWFATSGHEHNQYALSASLSNYIPQNTSGTFSLSGHNHTGIYSDINHNHNLESLNGQITISQISATGTPSNTNYLRGDGSWVTVSTGISDHSQLINLSANDHPQYSLSGHNHNGIYLTTDTSASFATSSHNHNSTYLGIGTSAYFASSAHQHQQSDITSATGWITSELSAKESTINKGQPSGYASLDETGRVPSGQLPSYVDDVLEYASLSAFPVSGTSGIIYIALDTNYTYRWGSSVYVRLDNPQIPVTTVAGRTGDVVLSASDIFGLNQYSLSGHNHDGRYLLSSTSADFSLSGHNHDSLYISLTSAVSFASSADAVLTENVISTVSAGSIIPGDTVTSGSNLTDFVKQLLLKTYYPTFTNPSSTGSSSPSGNIELGTISNTTITVTFNRGAITGKTVGGIWQPATFQDYRSGVATKYTISGFDNSTSASRVFNSYQFVEGNNTWSYSVQYAEGPQPVDSLGVNYNTPLSSGTSSGSVTLVGRRKGFYGTDSSSNVPYTTSTQIRSLANSNWSPTAGTTFTINIPVGAKQVVFAYPSTIRDVNSVVYVEGLNAEVKNIFTQTIVSVEGANSYSPTNYKLYTYVPATPFTATATYNVTI